MTSLPAMDPLPAHLQQHGTNPDLLRDELLAVIRHAIDAHPRSQQVALGPSEVGHPCARRIGYQFLEYDENPGEPAWKPTVGTAVHAWLEEQMTVDNVRQHQALDQLTRWVVEATVDAGVLGGRPLLGHCDLFDRVTGTVVDWKCVGPTQLRKYKVHGPGGQYRAQAHIYGKGWVRRGQHVERVAVMFLPRNGELRESVYWSEPYDQAIADTAIQRAQGIYETTAAMGDAALSLLPTADAFCSRCPFFRSRSTDLTVGCPGDAASQPRTPEPVLTFG